MHQQRLAGSSLELELAKRLQEWLTLDITDRTPNFNDRYFRITSARNHAAFYLIGDMGNNLYRAPEVVTSPLAT